MSNRGLAILSLFGLLSLVAVSSTFPRVQAADAAEAAAHIASVRTAILSSYQAVRQAESAGANVSVLLQALNHAGGSLSEADLAYAHGDYDAAVALAEQSINELDGVNEEAARLEVAAVDAAVLDFLVNVVGSSVATVVVVVGSYGVWRWLKRRSVAEAFPAGSAA